jgi:RimJ/RimL family protein N-acetyltransferase
VLLGERIRLRALEPSDEQAIWEWHQDHELHVLDGWIYPASHKQIAILLQNASEPGYASAWFGIETEDGKLIGNICLKRGRPEHRHAELGIAIERAYWNQGYGTDAVRTLLRFAFNEMGLHRVALGHVDDNDRAEAVYLKCGFKIEGRSREDKWRYGKWHDTVLMGVLDREFLALDSTWELQTQKA